MMNLISKYLPANAFNIKANRKTTTKTFTIMDENVTRSDKTNASINFKAPILKMLFEKCHLIEFVNDCLYSGLFQMILRVTIFKILLVAMSTYF